MMDKKTIIEEGLFEQYILGDLNAEQEQEIERILVSDDELMNHFETLEKDFEALGQENAIIPPAKVKVALLSQLKSEKIKETIDSTGGNIFKMYFGIAASVAALLLIGSFWMYSELGNLEQQIKTVETQNTELNTTIEGLNKTVSETSNLYAAIIHPDTEQFVLEGNSKMPDGKLVSYVNHTTKEVIINTQRLPQLDDQHDYQMWADVEGEMINMGVIDSNEQLIAMTYIEDSESLNITIEPSGGNDHPTVEQLVANVYLN